MSRLRGVCCCRGSSVGGFGGWRYRIGSYEFRDEEDRVVNEIILVEFRGRKEERRGSGRVLRFGNI